jgi:hypothetical protein
MSVRNLLGALLFTVTVLFFGISAHAEESRTFLGPFEDQPKTR